MSNFTILFSHSFRILDNENQQILDYFIKKLPTCESTEDISNYLEALYSEKKIRIAQEQRTVEKLQEIAEKKESEMNQVESMIKRLHYEINLFKQLGEIKNMRHAGIYKENADKIRGTEDGEDSSSVYDWIVDIDMITKVRV